MIPGPRAEDYDDKEGAVALNMRMMRLSNLKRQTRIYARNRSIGTAVALEREQ
jgi:hypothetical protein